MSPERSKADRFTNLLNILPNDAGTVCTTGFKPTMSNLSCRRPSKAAALSVVMLFLEMSRDVMLLQPRKVSLVNSVRFFPLRSTCFSSEAHWYQNVQLVELAQILLQVPTYSLGATSHLISMAWVAAMMPEMTAARRPAPITG